MAASQSRWLMAAAATVAIFTASASSAVALTLDAEEPAARFRIEPAPAGGTGLRARRDAGARVDPFAALPRPSAGALVLGKDPKDSASDARSADADPSEIRAPQLQRPRGGTRDASHSAQREASGAQPLLLPLALFGSNADRPSNTRQAAPAEFRLAQFQVPQAGSREGSGPARQQAEVLAKELDFQYSFGSDTEYIYERNLDLRKSLRDNLQTVAPTVFYLATTRPSPWFDLNFGFTAEQQFRIKEETITVLPDGTREPSLRRAFTVTADVANIVIKNIPDHPLEITIGRRTFEDPRLSLYDVTLDGVHVKYRGENYNTEASVTREEQWDLSWQLDTPKSTIKNYILYHEYRGIEDHKIAAYAIARLDGTPRAEGRFQLFGVRAYGRPWDEFNYWSEYGVVRGIDEARVPLPLRGSGFDVGGTYRFPHVPLAPCLTVATAYGSGDSDSRDGVNREYRQTGLQSNETKFCGVAQFKRYGEFIDPELSNLKIYTLGIGFRPAANIYVDLVHHQYKLNHNATDVRNGLISAQMNTRLAGLPPSRHVGRELDLIIAFRRLFDTKLAIDIRTGYFFPGRAYFRNDGGNNPASTTNPPRRAEPDRGLRVLAVLSY